MKGIHPPTHPKPVENVILCLMLSQDLRCNWATIVKTLSKQTEASEGGINHTLVKCRLAGHSIKTISRLLKAQRMKTLPQRLDDECFPCTVFCRVPNLPLGPQLLCRKHKD